MELSCPRLRREKTGYAAAGPGIQRYEDNPFDFLLDEYAVIHPFDYAEEDGIEFAPFLQSLY